MLMIMFKVPFPTSQEFSGFRPLDGRVRVLGGMWTADKRLGSAGTKTLGWRDGVKYDDLAHSKSSSSSS
jgi:hypothetical protein